MKKKLIYHENPKSSINLKRGMFGILMLFSFYINFSQSGNFDLKNIAFTEPVSIKKANSNSYYYEIRLINFGDEKLPIGFGLNGKTFIDNGTFNDEFSGDGIYSSKENHSKLNVINSKSSSGSYIYDDKLFAHKNNKVLENRGVGCEFVPCGCPCGEFTCIACELFGWSCLKITRCEIIIEF